MSNKIVVCRCEDVTWQEIKSHDDLRSAKLQTRCGMGSCQGRVCHSALRLLKGWPADSIRLDAYDGDAGSGPFYARCGYTEVGRVSYRGTPLVYYELVLS